MRVLWLGVDRSNQLGWECFVPIREAIEHQVETMVIDEIEAPGGIWPYAEQVRTGRVRLEPRWTPEEINYRFDVVISDAPFFWFQLPWERIEVPKIAYLNDTWGDHPRWYIQRCMEQHWHRWCRYRYTTTKYWPGLAGQFTWLPHAIDPRLFHDYGEKRTPGLVITGDVSWQYPLRGRARAELAGWSLCRDVPKPGLYERSTGWPVGLDYAALLASYQLGLADGPWGATVQKYFEIPACGTALLAYPAPDLPALGFQDGVNCFLVQEGSIKAQVERILADPDHLRQVALAGQQLVLSRHTVQQRAVEAVQALARLLAPREHHHALELV